MAGRNGFHGAAMKSAILAVGIVGLVCRGHAASPVISSSSAVSSGGGVVGGAAWGPSPSQHQVPPPEVTAAEDDTAVLLAPVLDAPAAGQVPAGALLTVDAAVFGEQIEGSSDWYFVTQAGEPPLRGFVHVSRVLAPE